MQIEIGDATGERWEMVEALLDTGATYTTMPAALLRRLGVAPHARDTFVLADGRHVEHDIGHGWIRVDRRSVVTLFVFGESDALPRLGAYALEGLRLAARAPPRTARDPRGLSRSRPIPALASPPLSE